MKKKEYDVIIIGAGPAGIFTALELTKKNNVSVLILEKGEEIKKRECLMRSKNGGCFHCSPCAIISGWGGAGAFSDGKLNLSTEIGGQLDNYIDKDKVAELIKYADDIYLEFGADKNVYGTDKEEIDIIKKEASLAKLKLIPTRIRHLGTEKCTEILEKMQDYLKTKIDIKTNTKVKEILVENRKAVGIETVKGEIIKGKYVVAMPGRAGSEWLKEQAEKMDIKIANNPVDVGVSMCPYGEVVTEFNDGIASVNGHSYQEHRTDNTNFAVLVSTNFTEPFKEPIAYGKYIAHLANILSGGVIVQRLGDLELGRRSTPDRLTHSIVTPTLKEATPGDLSFVLPYRIHTLLYGVEVKFYSSRLELSCCLETKVSNLFAAGDGAGITRGLIQASTSGIIVADEILRRRNRKK